MLVGEKLDTIRKALKLSKGNMAESIGLEGGSYSDIIRGKTKGISKSVSKLLELVHCVNLDYLNSDSQEMFCDRETIFKKYNIITPGGENTKLSEKEVDHLTEKLYYANELNDALKKQIAQNEIILNLKNIKQKNKK